MHPVRPYIGKGVQLLPPLRPIHQSVLAMAQLTSDQGAPLNNTQRHVVLVAPEVHWNTGNIGRTCLGAGADLHLIHPLGFSLESRQVKRAGLDYWHRVPLHVWDDFGHFLEGMQPEKNQVVLLTKNGTHPYWEMPEAERLFMLFGSETKGLPSGVLTQYREQTYRIPISKNIRCLELSTSVGIALYESLRPGL